MNSGGTNMYHHTLVLTAHLGPAQVFIAAAVAAGVIASGEAVRRLRRALHNT